MSLTELLDENAILVNLKATQKQEVIEELAAALTASGRISDNREVLQAVLGTREDHEHRDREGRRDSPRQMQGRR